MKCHCPYCDGNGVVRCEDCNGTGLTVRDITDSTPSDIDHLPQETKDEIEELKQDANRVKVQADRLKALRPDRAKSYQSQLEATMESINRQADQLLKTRTTAR